MTIGSQLARWFSPPDDLPEPASSRDAIYHERNVVVAVLSRLFPAGVKPTSIEGWDPQWHGCVYIDLPTGQVSWHYHDDDAHLFADLPSYQRDWDGHNTDQKYERLHELLRTPAFAWHSFARVSPLGGNRPS